MIRWGEREVADIRVGGKAIALVRKGTALVWEAIRGCFGKGFWINDKPWRNDDGWKNK